MREAASILCVSSIDWDFIWQGHQEIMSTLAAQGNRVLFLENTGVRPPTFRDLPRLRHRIRNWWRGTKGFREERPNLFVYSPVVLPFPYSRAARRINLFFLLRSLRRWMAATGFQRPIVWTFLPTPLARALIQALDPRAVIYYCIDDFASSSPSARRIGDSETRMFRDADLVFVTSEKLRERASRFSSRVHLFPFGVNLREFDRVRTRPEPLPTELAELSRPIVGYVGGVHQWVDQGLLENVANGLPDMTFVLVGPLQTDVSRLERCANVHCLGARPHGDIPRYIKGFDIGIVPYSLSEYTANVYPTKLNEYLAMGVPVVTTDLPEIRRFNGENANLVAIAKDAGSFAAALRVAVSKNSPAERAERVAAAGQNGWEQRIAAMSALIARAVETREAQAEHWDETLRRLYRTTRGRILGTAAAVAVTFWLAFYTPVVWWLARPLRITDAPRPADAIVVFAGGVGESGKAGGGYQDRMKKAVELYATEQAPRLILSSGFAFAFREAEVMRDLAVDHGVPDSAILLETKAGNTYQNVTFVRDIMRRSGWRRVLLVSSPYHMRRALLTWHKMAPEIDVACIPAASQFYIRDGSGANLEQLKAILHEYAAITVYWWRNWI